MKKLINLGFVLIILLCACNKQKDNSIEQKLYGNNYKYWLTYKYYPLSERDTIFSIEEPIYINYFDKNGKYLLFYKRNLLSEVEKDFNNYVPDIVESNTWSLVNDTILLINDIPHHIKSIEDDMMVLYSPYSKNYVLYIVAPDNLIPKKYRELQ